MSFFNFACTNTNCKFFRFFTFLLKGPLQDSTPSTFTDEQYYDAIKAINVLEHQARNEVGAAVWTPPPPFQFKYS